MTNPLIKFVNAETGEEIEREMNDDELAKWEADKAKAITQAAAELSKATEKAALLAKLGITEDEAKLLLS